MIVYDEVSQRTLDWANLRIGIPTASGLDNLVTPEFKLREGEMPRTYLYTKVAEAWRGEPLEGFGNFHTEQGEMIEPEARSFYALEYGVKVKEVGFISTDDKKFGCSPDGLINDHCGLEIKCPAAHTHVKYLMGGTVPKDYIAQVHGSMYATGFNQWVFMSYRRGFPALVITVERDEAIIAKIQEALDRFHSEFEKAMAQVRVFEKAAA